MEEKNYVKGSKMNKIIKLYKEGRIGLPEYQSDYEDMELVFDTWLELNKIKTKDESITKHIEFLVDILENYAKLYHDNDLTEEKYPEINQLKLDKDDPHWVWMLFYDDADGPIPDPVPENIMQKVYSIRKEYIKEKAEEGYATFLLNKYDGFIKQNNKAFPLVNKIDEIYEKCFNNMKHSDPYFKKGYDDKKNYNQDTILIMQNVVDFIKQNPKQKLSNKQLKDLIVDLYQVFNYYNRIANYRELVGYCWKGQEGIEEKNPYLFKIDLQKLSSKLLGFETCEKKIKHYYTDKEQVFEPGQDHLPYHLQDWHYENTEEEIIIPIYCSKNLKIDRKNSLALDYLAEQKKIMIGESYGHFKEYDMSKLYAWPYKGYNNNKKSYIDFLTKMEKRYDNFIPELYDAIRYSAEKIVNNCVKEHFEIENHSNKEIKEVQEEELTK